MGRKRVYNFLESKPSYMIDDTSFNPWIATEDSTKDPRFDVETKKPYLGEIVTRSTVWDYYRTTVSLPNPSLILFNLGKNIEEFDQLLADGRVKAAYNNRRAGTLSLKWTIDQNDSPSRLYKVVKKVFDQYPIYDIMGEMMFAPFYGYNVSEVIWSKEDGMILPTNIAGKAQRWFVYDDLNGLRYKTKVNQVQGEPLPPRKFIVTRYHPTYTDPYSGMECIANAVYWPVKFRHLVIKYGMNFIERYATPWLDVTMEAGLQQERLQEILNVLQQTFQDGIVAHPDNTKIQSLNMSDSRSVENYTQFLDMLNREIDMAILGTNLTSEVKGGSYAAAAVHAGIRKDIVEEDKRMIEAAMNQLIEWIAWYNFAPSDTLPKFRLYENDPPTLDRANIDKALFSMGVKFEPEYIERTYGVNSEEFTMGAPPTVEIAGMKQPNDGSVTPDKSGGLSDADNKTITESGVESKEQTTDSDTDEAITRSQRKGYPFSESKEHSMIFLRHGSTELNGDAHSDRIRGWNNVQLSDKGKKESMTAAKEISKDYKIDTIITSDLDRAEDTANMVAKETGAKVIKTKALRPWNLGEFTGMHSAKAAPQIQEYINNPDKVVPDGESFNSFKDRFLNEVERIKRELPGKRVLLVSHHRGDRLLKSWQACGYNAQHEISSAVMAKRGGVEPGAHREFKI